MTIGNSTLYGPFIRQSTSKISLPRLVLCILTGMLCATGGARADEALEVGKAAESAPVIEAPKVDDSLGRLSPRSAFIGYISAADNHDYQLAAQYLDLRNISAVARKLSGEELAKSLHIVLQRTGWIDVDGLSDRPLGVTGDNLPPYRELLTRIQFKDQNFSLLLQRVPATNGEFIWKISNATVSSIPMLYDLFGYGSLLETVDEWVPDYSILGLKLFKWIVMLGTGVLAAPFVFGIAWLVGRSLPIRDQLTKKQVARLLVLPVSLLIIVLIMRAMVSSLGVGVTTQQTMAGWTAATIVSTWLLIEGVRLFQLVYPRKLIAKGRPHAVVLLKPIATAVKVLIVLFAFIIWLDNIGIDVTALLAGLGVGGIAVALALQRPTEDFLAALTLFTQQPVKVGDFCRFGDTLGTVEEIGLRATQLRTLANTVVTMPNARFAAEYIENISVRKKILFNPTIKIDYDTTRPRMEEVLANIKAMLEQDDKVIQGDWWVRYRHIGSTSHDVEIYVFIDTTDWRTYLQIAERLNLKILDAVDAAGTKLAVPIQQFRTTTDMPDTLGKSPA